MSLPSPDNPHTVHKPTHELFYWFKGKASGAIGADRVEVFQVVNDKVSYSIGVFSLPDEEERLNRLESVLMCAFECGRRDKARELRKALGL